MIVDRAFAPESIDLGFDLRVGSNQTLQKIGIYSFHDYDADRLATQGLFGDKAGTLDCHVPGKAFPQLFCVISQLAITRIG